MHRFVSFYIFPNFSLQRIRDPSCRWACATCNVRKTNVSKTNQGIIPDVARRANGSSTAPWEADARSCDTREIAGCDLTSLRRLGFEELPKPIGARRRCSCKRAVPCVRLWGDFFLLPRLSARILMAVAGAAEGRPSPRCILYIPGGTPWCTLVSVRLRVWRWTKLELARREAKERHSSQLGPVRESPYI